MQCRLFLKCPEVGDPSLLALLYCGHAICRTFLERKSNCHRMWSFMLTVNPPSLSFLPSISLSLPPILPLSLSPRLSFPPSLLPSLPLSPSLPPSPPLPIPPLTTSVGSQECGPLHCEYGSIGTFVSCVIVILGRDGRNLSHLVAGYQKKTFTDQSSVDMDAASQIQKIFMQVLGPGDGDMTTSLDSLSYHKRRGYWSSRKYIL